MFRITHNIPEAIRSIERARRLWIEQRPMLLEAIGVKVLSLSQEAYVAKARGGVGSDGIRWKPLDRATLAARVRARGPGRRIVAERKRIAGQIRATKGRGAGLRIARLRKRRKELLAQLERLIDAEVARHEIGVDTGLQRASASPGFQDTDGRGGNVLNVDAADAMVTVGYGRSYSAAFDEKRPLLPSTMPDAWMEAVEKVQRQWGERILATIGGERPAGL